LKTGFTLVECNREVDEREDQAIYHDFHIFILPLVDAHLQIQMDHPARQRFLLLVKKQTS
jgi:hypothetical protein